LGILRNSTLIRRISENREGKSRADHADNSERPKTDHFHRRVSGRITFCHLFSVSEPVGAKTCQIELKIQSPDLRRRDLSVSTAESFVLTPAPIGKDRQFPRACFSRLPRTRPGAEAGRHISKSILIGAPIPYAERPSAGSCGEPLGDRRTHSFTAALVPRTGHCTVTIPVHPTPPPAPRGPRRPFRCTVTIPVHPPLWLRIEILPSRKSQI
jgi:hypothetical protein